MFDFFPTAMDATSRPFLFGSYMAVYAPDSLGGECLLWPTTTLAGTQKNFLALIFPLGGVIDLLKLREREVDFAESLGYSRSSEVASTKSERPTGRDRESADSATCASTLGAAKVPTVGAKIVRLSLMPRSATSEARDGEQCLSGR